MDFFFLLGSAFALPQRPVSRSVRPSIHPSTPFVSQPSAAVGFQLDDPLSSRVAVVQIQKVCVWIQAVLTDIPSHLVQGTFWEGYRAISSHFALSVVWAADELAVKLGEQV